MVQHGIARARVLKVQARKDASGVVWDQLAVEAPLEIRLGFGPNGRRSVESLAVTMRTPGHDEELAAGFLLSERIIPTPQGIADISREALEDQPTHRENVLRVDLVPEVEPRLLERRFHISSSCGVCGTATLEALNLDGCPPLNGPDQGIDSSLIHHLPELLRARQSVFEATGGLHAAAFVTNEGGLIAAREDIGRHNAVDKLVGARALGTLDGPEAGSEPLALVVSGRAGFEIVQKALIAQVPIVAAVGAPSSLAVEVAESFGLTLLGFVNFHRFNIYSGPRRVLIQEWVEAPTSQS